MGYFFHHVCRFRIVFEFTKDQLILKLVFTGALSASMASRYIKTKGNLSAAIAVGGAGVTLLNLYSYYSMRKN